MRNRLGTRSATSSPARSRGPSRSHGSCGGPGAAIPCQGAGSPPLPPLKKRGRERRGGRRRARYRPAPTARPGRAPRRAAAASIFLCAPSAAPAPAGPRGRGGAGAARASQCAAPPPRLPRATALPPKRRGGSAARGGCVSPLLQGRPGRRPVIGDRSRSPRRPTAACGQPVGEPGFGGGGPCEGCRAPPGSALRRARRRGRFPPGLWGERAPGLTPPRLAPGKLHLPPPACLQ